MEKSLDQLLVHKNFIYLFLYFFFYFFKNFDTEHVWQVNIQKKELGERRNINGPYRLCLTDRTLSLVKLGAKDKSESIDIAVSN